MKSQLRYRPYNEPEPEENIQPQYKRSPKRTAIYLLIGSYIAGILSFAFHFQAVQAFMPAFLIVTAVSMHIAAFLCICWIDERN